MNRLRRWRCRRYWQAWRHGRRVAQLPLVEQIGNQQGNEQDRNRYDEELRGVDKNDAPAKLAVTNAIDDGGLEDEKLCGNQDHETVGDCDLPHRGFARPDELEKGCEQEQVNQSEDGKRSDAGECGLDGDKPEFKSLHMRLSQALRPVLLRNLGFVGEYRF